MLTKRIIPCLDMTEGKVVKGIQFVNFRDAGDPVILAKKYDEQGADELVFLDITATVDNRNILLDVVKKTAKEVTIPFTVGGGIRTKKDMQLVLRAGADKVGVNTGAFKRPALISECAQSFGTQCVVLSLDAKRIGSQWNVIIDGGRTDTGISAIEWAQQAVKLGAGEILLTSIDADGMKQGFDIKLTRAVTQVVNVPIIASGGAGKLEVFGELTIKQVKQYLIDNNISGRL